MIDTAAQGFISLLAVVQEGDQEEKWYLFISKLLISAIVKLYLRVKNECTFECLFQIWNVQLIKGQLISDINDLQI